MNALQLCNGFQGQNETWPLTDIYSLVFTGRSKRIISAGALEVKNIGEVSKWRVVECSLTPVVFLIIQCIELHLKKKSRGAGRKKKWDKPDYFILEAAFSLSKPNPVKHSVGNARGLGMRNVQIRHEPVPTLSQRWSERGNEKIKECR